MFISVKLSIILGPQRLVENHEFLGPSRTQERVSTGRIVCFFMIFFFNIPNHNVFDNRCFTLKNVYNIEYFFQWPPQKERTSFFLKKDNLFRNSILRSANHYELSFEKNALVSSLTRSSMYPHRRWVCLSINIKTLKKTSIKKRSWSSKIM